MTYSFKLITPQSVKKMSKLSAIAKSYVEKGYKVAHNEKLTDDETESEFSLDLVARNDNETVVVEVIEKRTAENFKRLDRLARAIEHRPRWRLEAILLRESNAGASRVLDATEIAKRLAEVQILTTARHNEAALLLSWTAIEALLRELAQQENIDSTGSAISIANELVFQGILSQQEYETLDSAIRLRNEIADGFMTTATNEHVGEALALAESIQHILNDANQTATS